MNITQITIEASSDTEETYGELMQIKKVSINGVNYNVVPTYIENVPRIQDITYAGGTQYEDVENKYDYTLILDVKGNRKDAPIYCKDCKYNYNNIEKDPLCATNEKYDEMTDIVCTYWESDGLSNYDYCSQAREKEKNK